MLAVFVAFFKQQLHAKANTHQGLTGIGLLDHHFVKTGCTEFIGSIAECAHTGKDKSVSRALQTKIKQYEKKNNID